MAKWTREEIIRQILHREAAGLPLTPGGETGVESPLYQAASRFFGSWHNAVRSAGIAPERTKTYSRWPPLRVLATIRALSRRRRPVRQAQLRRRFAPLLAAARRIYGSWPKAVVAAGVDPFRFRQVAPWTKERIIEAVLTRALKNEPLGSRTVRPRSLAEAAARLYGSWGSALAAAGLDPKQYTGRASGAGPAMETGTAPSVEQSTAGCITKVQDSPIMAKAGHNGRGRKFRRWSDEKILKVILTRLQKHKLLNAAAVRDDDECLYSAAKKRYGNWSAALLAAGLNPDEFRGRGGRGNGGQKPTADVAELANGSVPEHCETLSNNRTSVASTS